MNKGLGKIRVGEKKGQMGGGGREGNFRPHSTFYLIFPLLFKILNLFETFMFTAYNFLNNSFIITIKQSIKIHSSSSKTFHLRNNNPPALKLAAFPKQF